MGPVALFRNSLALLQLPEVGANWTTIRLSCFNCMQETSCKNFQSSTSQRWAVWNKMQLVGLWSLAVVLDALASFSNAQTATPATGL